MYMKNYNILYPEKREYVRSTQTLVSPSPLFETGLPNCQCILVVKVSRNRQHEFCKAWKYKKKIVKKMLNIC